MSSPSVDVSVIVVSYNTKELLKDSLNSVIACTSGLEYQIIVVDNNSSDDSANMVKEYFPAVELIESKENLGFGAANNLAVTRAVGEYLLFLNPDTIFKSNALLLLFDFMKRYGQQDRVGVCGAYLTLPDGRAASSNGFFPTIGSEVGYIGGKLIERFRGDRKTKGDNFLESRCTTIYREVDYVIGADIFISTELFNSLGGFDRRFFLYYEETDLQKRVADAGLKRVLIEGPQIVHLEGGSIPSQFKFSFKRFAHNHKSLIIYIKKHYKEPYRTIFTLMVTLLRAITLFDRRFTKSERFGVLRVLLKGGDI